VRTLVTLVLATTLFASPRLAAADAKANEILKKVEYNLNSFKDITIKFLLTVKNPGKPSIVRFETLTRPGGQRIVKLTYPGDVKGMTILVQSIDEMYIYLPAFRKVRRIAGHVRNQGFLGSGFTYDDMAISRFVQYYDAKLLSETPTHWVIDCVTKPGQTPPYYRIKMFVRKDIALADQMQFFNQRGQHTKTQEFIGHKCRPDKSHCNPTIIRMIEVTRNNLVSQMDMISQTYDKGYPDRLFTVRALTKSGD
jgi:outer membrane lipoprotein-sorting protein